MANYKTKPVFTPISKIRTSQYTEGQEYSLTDTYEEYTGLYHIYPNGAVYTGPVFDPNNSVPLMPYVVQGQDTNLVTEEGLDAGVGSKNNSMYFKVTESRFHKHYPPPYYYPQPLKEAYELGHFSRFFAQKINNLNDITEISPDEYNRKNSSNDPGIDAGLYRFVTLKWTIDGPINEVRQANARVINHANEQQGFKTLDRYLTDLDEYHRDFHKIPE